jgi:hypothetical protein
MLAEIAILRSRVREIELRLESLARAEEKDDLVGALCVPEPRLERHDIRPGDADAALNAHKRYGEWGR